MLKKFLLTLSIAVTVTFMSSCGGARPPAAELVLPDEAPASPTASDSSEIDEEEKTAYLDLDYKDYEDSFEGLCEYFEDSYIVSGESIVMSYDVIGAQNGVKYAFTYRTKPIQVELYWFDPDNISEVGETTLKSIKDNGKFTVLDSEVDASVSENSEFVMIYMDSSADQENKNQKERAEELLSSFYAK